MKQLSSAVAAASLLVLAGAPGVRAQTAPNAPDYSPDEFVRAILAGPASCPSGKSAADCEADPKTRRFMLAPASDMGAVTPGKPARRRLSASDILVTFRSGSAEITPAGRRNLQSVATGLNRPALKPIRFEVAGYTDATGKPAYNLELSKRRAEAVRQFLIAREIEPERLQAVGFGSDHLANPARPAADENRRVEMHRLN